MQRYRSGNPQARPASAPRDRPLVRRPRPGRCGQPVARRFSHPGHLESGPCPGSARSAPVLLRLQPGSAPVLIGRPRRRFRPRQSPGQYPGRPVLIRPSRPYCPGSSPATRLGPGPSGILPARPRSRPARSRAFATLVALVLGAGGLALPFSSALSQTPLATVTRGIPASVAIGSLRMDVFPRAYLDGKEVFVAPGFRLLDALNRSVVPSTAIGTTFVVAYQLGPIGEVRTAWILSDAERAELRQRADAAGS